MKTKNLTLVVVLTLANLAAFSNPDPEQLSSNYVVIGAFSLERNAIQFAQIARKDHYNAEVQMNPHRGLYYVYVLHTGDHTEAIEEAKRLRSKTLYNDSWVYVGSFDTELRQSGGDVDPVSDTALSSVVVESPQPAIKVDESNAGNQNVSNAVEDMDGTGKRFFFKIYVGTTGAPADGEVEIIDVDRQKRANTLEGNKDVKLLSLNNKSGNFSAECQVFGYRKITQLLNFSTPETSDGVTVEEGKITVPFELVRLKKGDYSVMYNVLFYKDAAIMRPESKYEVDELLEMMQENPKYKIRIHGHTNGKASGKIVSVGESNNFFSLAGTKEGFGSAKKLSEERANSIKNYLVANGIAEDRLDVKAWGGKKPIYEKTHAQAHNNVRVEVEIVEE